MQGQQVEVPLVLACHRRQPTEEQTLLRQCLRDPPGSVHARDGMKHPLPTVGQDALGLLTFQPVARGS